MRALNAAAIRGETKSIAAMRRLSEQIRSDIWNRWLAIAQKRALIWWRDRSVAPGLNARFTAAGATYYGFAKRLRKPSSLRPYYHVTGSLQRALMARKPKTKQASRNAGVVQTILKFGGLALNLMTTTGKPDMRGVVGYTREVRTVTQSFNVGSYTRPVKGGGSVVVAGYSMNRRITRGHTKPVRGGETHGALFGKFNRDAPAIQARVQVEMRRILRASAYDKRTGLLKSSVVTDVDLHGAAA